MWQYPLATSVEVLNKIKKTLALLLCDFIPFPLIKHQADTTDIMMQKALLGDRRNMYHMYKTWDDTTWISSNSFFFFLSWMFSEYSAISFEDEDAIYKWSRLLLNKSTGHYWRINNQWEKTSLIQIHWILCGWSSNHN